MEVKKGETISQIASSFGRPSLLFDKKSERPQRRAVAAINAHNKNNPKVFLMAYYYAYKSLYLWGIIIFRITLIQGPYYLITSSFLYFLFLTSFFKLAIPKTQEGQLLNQWLILWLLLLCKAPFYQVSYKYVNIFKKFPVLLDSLFSFFNFLHQIRNQRHRKPNHTTFHTHM